MVDNILNDKDNSRLSLFEEAAGISKFRKRKKETFNKIRQTENDLDRVEDLVYEIEKNLRSLKRQAKQTEKYYSYKEEYKNVSINVALKNSESSRKKLKENKIKLTKIEDENTKVSSELAKKNATIESSKSSLIPYEKKLQSKQESLNKILDKIRDHEELIRIKAEKRKILNESVSELKKSIKFDEESNSRSKFSIKSIEKEAKSVKKSIQKTLGKLDENKKEYLKYEEKLKNQNIKISDIKDVEDQFQEISNNIKNIASKKHQLVKLMSLEKIDKKNVLKNLNSLDLEIQSIDKSFKIIEDLFRADNKETIRINKLFSDKSKDLSTTEIDYNNLKSKLESLEKELEYKSITYDFNKKRINKNQLKLEESEKEITSLSSIDDEKDDILIKLYDNKSVSESDLENSENEYYKIKSNIDLDDTSVRELQKKKDINIELIDELKTGIYDTELDLNSINQRISVEFDLKLSDCKIDADLLDNNSIEKLESRRDILKDKIEKIGQINPLAMEAYKEINERHEFIIKEREDLFEAKDSLLKTIQEIDLVAKESFINSFEKIKDNFKTVFRSLFTEDDDCDLVINDPENPLESSIEIMAKPKGKKPLTINQLSGGEKTLTATSLLFAIYLLKPAPFCVFDEVDAPLDDNNIDKFNKIINKFSSSSQFIIVTHNKRTMNNADIIYGITMPEQGVSKVVPVDLRNLKV
jgi:chromosome segregation protein